MKMNVLNNEFTGKTPCRGCKYEDKDKNECAESCLRLEAYRHGLPCSHLPDFEKSQNKKCLICGREESDKVKIRRGLCVSPCYQNWRKGILQHPTIGDFVKMTQQELNEARHGKLKKCLIDGCSEIGDRRGLCQKGGHYKKWVNGRLLHPELGEFVSSRKTKMKVVEKSLMHGMEDALRKHNLDKAKLIKGRKETKTEIKLVEKSLFHEKAEIDAVEQNLAAAVKRIEGRKEIENKVDYSFMPMSVLDGVARVFETGSKKNNGRFTWQPGIRYSLLFSAIMRHLLDWFFKGIDKDAESGEHPLAHVIADAMMILSYLENKQFDDRPKKNLDKHV